MELSCKKTDSNLPKVKSLLTCSSIAGQHCIRCAEDKFGMVITSNLYLIISNRDLNKELCLKTKAFYDCFRVTDGTSQVRGGLSAIFVYRPNNPRDAIGSHVYKITRLYNFYEIPQNHEKLLLASTSLFLPVNPPSVRM